MINWPRFRAWLKSWVNLPEPIAATAHLNSQIIGHLVMIRGQNQKIIDALQNPRLPVLTPMNLARTLDIDEEQKQMLLGIEEDIKKNPADCGFWKE
jgi:hypothetical protein